MALKDKITLGMSLPHRSPEPIEMSVVRQVAQRADALGFRDLWVTENTLDHVFSFDPIVILTYAATLTTRIRVGVSVAVLPVQNPIHVAHHIATLDYTSNGRAILGVGLGRDQHYTEFQVPREHRIRRFREEVGLVRGLWTEPKISYRGSIYHLEAGAMSPKPVQKPHPPIWFGGGHPDATRRAAATAAARAGGGGGAGGSSHADFKRSVPLLREHLEKARRDPKTFPISKRVFLAVDERADFARDELHRWFSVVYHNPAGPDACGVHGTPQQVRERLEELVAAGANHLLLNPIARHVEQIEALASIAGRS